MKDSTSIKEANKADGNNICDTHIWQQECDNLKEFICVHSQIEITDKSLKLPQDVRFEFWELFDQFRLSFLSNNYFSMLEESNILVHNYQNIAKELKHHLEPITTASYQTL
jgi:hypothetical protein